MNQKGRAPQKRKIPFKKRMAIIIVNIADEIEKSKAEKQKAKRQQARGQGKPAPQGIPVKGGRRPANPGQRQAQGQPRSPMTPQEQRRQAAIMAKRRRQKVRNIRIAIGVVVFLLIALILSRTVLFRIQTVEVENPGDAKYYTADQIATESGVLGGSQNLFACDLDKVERNIEQRLPYIGDAVVKRDFPSSLRVTVTPTEDAAAMVYGTGYLMIDKDGKMLMSTQDAPEGVPILRCNTEFEMNLGQYIGVSQEKKPDEKTEAAAETMALFKKVAQAAKDAGIDDITLIDIRDTHAITLMYQNRLTLHLGTEDMLDTKLNTGARTIAAQTDTSHNRTGAIDLTVVPYSFARDTYEPISEVDSSEPATEIQGE